MTGRNRTIMAAGALTLAAAMIFVYIKLTNVLGWMPVCPIHHLTGLSCPGCGSQRALAALAEGRVAEAWSHNYLLPFALAYLILCGLHWTFPINNIIGRIYSKATTPGALIAVAVTALAWMIVRNILGC